VKDNTTMLGTEGRSRKWSIAKSYCHMPKTKWEIDCIGWEGWLGLLRSERYQKNAENRCRTRNGGDENNVCDPGKCREELLFAAFNAKGEKRRKCHKRFSIRWGRGGSNWKHCNYMPLLIGRSVEMSQID